MALRSAVGMALVAVLLFGCGAGPGATASLPVEPSPSAPAGSPSAPPPAPTDVPTATPAPSSTAVCASDLETNIASVEELADPSCYGDTELTEWLQGVLPAADKARSKGHEGEALWRAAVEENVLDALEIHLVSHMDEVLKIALAGPLTPLAPTPDTDFEESADATTH